MEEFTSFAKTLADRAGEIARSYFRASLDIISKADESPVTRADREIESALASMISAKFPDHGIFGEEHERINPNSSKQWIIDPIDGTRAFIAGVPTFTTLIAFVENDLPVFGLIDQPISRERWIGGKNTPTTLNAKPVRTKTSTTLSTAAIGTTSAPYYFSASETEAFERLRSQCAHTIVGGDGYGYAMLANGHLDLFADTCLKPYDFCAIAPVVEAAGGVITDWQGKPLTIHSNGSVLAAANAELHAQALRLLK